MISAARIVPYLLERGLLTSRELIEQPLRVERTSGRNHNLLVTGSAAGGYFVKQGKSQEAVEAIGREARLYDALAAAGTLGDHLPVSRGHDPIAGTLILDTASGAEDLLSYHTRHGRFPLGLARELGRALALLHRDTRAWVARPPSGVSLSPARPFVLELRQLPLHVLSTASAAALQLVRLCQTQAPIDALLAELADDVRVESVIHGDIRLRNAITHRTAARGARRVELIDWESAALGDPSWDLGSLLSAYLSLWASSVPVVRTDRPEQLVAHARFPLPRIRPALRALLNAYRATRWQGAPAQPDWLARATRFAAAHLLHTAYEMALQATELTSEPVALVQLSLNMIDRGEQAASELFGISEHAQ